MAENRLTDLQREFLKEFFRREKRFFLSGGAALSGFYFGHRETHDLDLFTLEDILDEGFTAIKQTADILNATVESIQTTPDFRRFLISRKTDAIVVDIVREYVPQMFAEKPVINGIRVDAPEEILANKLCALLSRSEIRDLIDVFTLEKNGYRIEDVFAAAASKDGGLTPAQLAWILSQISLSDELNLPAEITVDELRKYLENLINRLTNLAFPDSK